MIIRPLLTLPLVYDYKSFRGVKDVAELSPSRMLEFYQVISMARTWELSNLEELEARESTALPSLAAALPKINDRATRSMMAAFPDIVDPKLASTGSKETPSESGHELAGLLRDSEVLNALEVLKDFLAEKWRPINPATAI